MTAPHYRISLRETAKRYSVSVRTIRRWRESDPEFPRPHRKRGQWWWWNHQLDAFDAENPELVPQSEAKADA